MGYDMNRRLVLTGGAGAGLVAAGGLGLLTSACSPKKAVVAQGDLPVKILSSQGVQVITIQELMNRKGYFKEFGLSASAIAANSGTTVIGPLLNQQADVCIFAGFGQLLNAIEKGAALKILGAASVKGQQALFSKNPAVKTLKDLEGKSIGVGAIGAQLHQVALALLRKHGVDVNKVKFVTVGSSGDVFRAVIAGTVDAGNGQADVLSSLDKFGVHMVEGGDYATALPEFTWQASFTSTKTIAEKRETLVRTLAAYAKAFRYVQNPGSKDDFVAAQLAGLDSKNPEEATKGAISQWEYLQERKIYAEDLVLSPERVQYMQELNVETGGQKKIMPYEQIIDTSIAKEAIARLDAQSKT